MAASPICSGLLLSIACSSVAVNSYRPRVREQLLVPLCCPSVQDAEQKCRRCQGQSSSRSGWASASTTSLCLATLGPAAQTDPPERAGSLPWPHPPGLLGPRSSALLHPASWVFGEQKKDRRQTHAKGDGSTFSSWSLGVANLAEKVGVELIQDTVCSCVKMHSLYIYIHLQRSKEGFFAL